MRSWRNNKWFRRGLGVVVAGIVFLAGNFYHVTQRTTNRLFDHPRSMDHRAVGLLLGTSKYLTNGRINLYYQYRLEAAIQLFRAKKIDYLLVSGDNSTKRYNEPATFKADLIAAGIPEDRIYLDYAGFRTLDSVVRAKKVFGQEKVTIISQAFHNARAVYLAQRSGLDAIAFNARDVSQRYGWRVIVREYLARAKMQLDLLLKKPPKFLGQPISIP